MSSWQKRTRVGLAIFGVVFSTIVYFAIGERRALTPGRPVERFDQKASVETVESELQRYREGDQDFTIRSARSLTYEDGSAKLLGVEITVPKADGRTYVVTAEEAQAGPNEGDRLLSGRVTLKVSDGFELTTDRASHNPGEGVVRAPGAVSFKKGGMSGSGTNATYDQNKDLLTINENAKINIAAKEGRTLTDFSAGAAVLDRLQNVLTLDGNAHVLRDEQVIDADRVTSRLSDDEQIIHYVELRNNARVTGGTSIDSMSARDIDMDYSDDGRALERVALVGGAGIAMKGSGDRAGRQVVGESVEARMAVDGTIVGMTGRGKVRLDLPASGDSPPGSIRAEELDGSGEPGRGLTAVEFRESVEYREVGTRGTADRVVRARTLHASLGDDTVTDAAFKGRVTFDDEGVHARAGDLRYLPRDNRIALRSAAGEGMPHVTLDQIAIDASAIDVGLEERKVDAVDVKTTISPAAAGREGGKPTGVAIPGLLRQNEAARVNANSLEYRGQAGQAVYRGGATMWQGQTTIRADAIAIDQGDGSLVATGAARSTLELDTGVSTGHAHEIRYDDKKRLVTYSAAALAPTSGRGSASPAARGGAPAPGRSAVPVRIAQLSGPQGDLRAERIEIVLGRDGNKVERLEAYTNVTLKLDTRDAIGARLTYHASDERYVMSGTGTLPVTIVSRTSSGGTTSCRETKGQTLTFYKSTDTIEVDGNEQQRTETQMKPCAPTMAR